MIDYVYWIRIFGFNISFLQSVILLMIHLIIVIILAWWIYHDVERRDGNPLVWSILAFLFGFIAIGIWLYYRVDKKKK